MMLRKRVSCFFGYMVIYCYCGFGLARIVLPLIMLLHLGARGRLEFLAESGGGG
jgi:hypothetical protein